MIPQTVVITRPADQAEEFARLLDERGLPYLLFPTLTIRFCDLDDEISRALERVERAHYRWIAFTSANGVRALAHYLHSARLSIPTETEIAAQGIVTANACRELLGREPSLVPPSPVLEHFALAFAPLDLHGKSVLLPGPVRRRDVLSRAIEAQGGEAHTIALYRTEQIVPPEPLLSDLTQRDPESLLITCFSPSACHGFRRAVHGDLHRYRFAAFGPVTAQALRDLGMVPLFEYRTHDAEGFADEIRRRLSHATGGS